MGLKLLCDGDRDKRIKVSVLDYDKAGKHSSIGSFETTVNKLIENKVDGLGSGDNFDATKTLTLQEDGKETGKIVVLSAHADAPKPKKPGPEVLSRASSGELSAVSSMISGDDDDHSKRPQSPGRYSRDSHSFSESSFGSKSSRRSYSSRSRRSFGSRSSKSRSISKSEEESESSFSKPDQLVASDERLREEDSTLQLTLYGHELANDGGFSGVSGK